MNPICRTIKEMLAAGERERDAGLSAPENIRCYSDIVYGPDPQWHLLDIYKPRHSDSDVLPVIVHVHGGGWIYGSKESYQFYCMELAKQGFCVVNYTYRLAPEYQFPAPILDTHLVFSWVKAHGEEYGMDLENVFGIGDSAGAHTLGCYAAAITNTIYSSAFSIDPTESFLLNAIIFHCGIFHLAEDDSKEMFVRVLQKQYIPNTNSPKLKEAFDFEEHISTEFPPVFISMAQNDIVNVQADSLLQKLEGSGIYHQSRMYRSQTEELKHCFQYDLRSNMAFVCMQEDCQFFLQHLKTES